MLNSLLSRVLSAPDSPSADLYFLNACGDFLGRGVKRLAPTVFASASACLVIRHDMRLTRLPEAARLLYLLDDDVGAGLTDESLPFFYRQKLRMVEAEAGRRLAQRASQVVVSSPRIASMLGRPDAPVLLPYWSDPFAGLDHFEPLLAGKGRIDVAYLGSVVHRTDLALVAPVVERLLDEEPRVRFHVPGRHRLTPRLEAHPRVVRIPGCGWTAYRREIRMRRFHIALYPLLDTPFNRARSPNKLIEHSVVGAAPLYSRSWTEAGRVEDGRSGLLLSNDPRAWLEAVRALIADPARMLTIAEGARGLATRLNDPVPQRRLWQQEFGLLERAVA